MFFYKLEDGRTINLDHIVMIAPLAQSEGVRLEFANGQSVLVLGNEWHDMEQLAIDSYTFERKLK